MILLLLGSEEKLSISICDDTPPLPLGSEEKLLPKFSPSEMPKLQKLVQNGQISDFFSMHHDFQKAPANCSNNSLGFCLFLDFSLLHTTAC